MAFSTKPGMRTQADNITSFGTRTLASYDHQNRDNNDDRTDGIVALTRNFYNTIAQNSVNVNAKIIEGIISIFDNIIKNPYDDRSRVVEYMHYNKSKLFSYPSCLQYLRDLGFIDGKKDNQLLFPYDLMIAKLIRAKDVLSGIQEQTNEEIEILDVENRTDFPYFQQYCQILGCNLVMKNYKIERQRLQLTIDEVSEIYAQTRASSLEEMIVEFMADPQSFQSMAYSILSSQQKAKEFISMTVLVQMVNVLRKFGVYIMQCFSDDISRAPLHLPHDISSKIARQILMIDLLQAQGVVKMSQQQIVSMEDLIRVFLIRHQLQSEEVSSNFQALDLLLEKALYSREKVDSFWVNIEVTIVERISGLAKKKRPLLDLSQYQKWCSLNPPPLEPEDLPNYAKDRLMLQASEVLGIDLNTGIDQLNELEPQERNAKLKKLRDLIWEPRVWLHQKDLTDDYIVYVAVRDMCDHANADMSLDIRREFRDFIKGGMPTLELPESMGNTTIFQHSAFKLTQKSTDFLTGRSQKSQKSQRSTNVTASEVSVNLLQDQGEAWRLLYRKVTPAILHSCVINKHKDLLKEFLQQGAFINIRDHKKWTPLHCAAMVGDVDLVRILLDFKAEIEAEDENGRTPFQIAVEYGNYFGELNVCSIMLDKGLEVDEPTWDMLLMYSLENDIVCYVRLAHRYKVFLHNVDDSNKFSLHLAVRFQAANIIRTLIDLFDPNTLRAFSNARDLDGRVAEEWAMNTQNEEVIQLVKRISGNRLVSRVPEILEEEEQNFKNNENNMKMTIEKLMEENNLRESLMNLSKLKHAESQKQIASQVQKAEYFDDQDVRAMNEEHSSAKRYFETADDYAHQAIKRIGSQREKKPTNARAPNPIVSKDDDSPDRPQLLHLIRTRIDESQVLQRQYLAEAEPWKTPYDEVQETKQKLNDKDGEIQELKQELSRQTQQVEEIRSQLKEQLQQAQQQTELLTKTQSMLQQQLDSGGGHRPTDQGSNALPNAERQRHDDEMRKMRAELDHLKQNMNQNVQKYSDSIEGRQRGIEHLRQSRENDILGQLRDAAKDQLRDQSGDGEPNFRRPQYNQGPQAIHNSLNKSKNGLSDYQLRNSQPVGKPPANQSLAFKPGQLSQMANKNPSMQPSPYQSAQSNSGSPSQDLRQSKPNLQQQSEPQHNQHSPQQSTQQPTQQPMQYSQQQPDQYSPQQSTQQPTQYHQQEPDPYSSQQYQPQQQQPEQGNNDPYDDYDQDTNNQEEIVEEESQYNESQVQSSYGQLDSNIGQAQQSNPQQYNAPQGYNNQQSYNPNNNQYDSGPTSNAQQPKKKTKACTIF